MSRTGHPLEVDGIADNKVETNQLSSRGSSPRLLLELCTTKSDGLAVYRLSPASGSVKRGSRHSEAREKLLLDRV